MAALAESERNLRESVVANERSGSGRAELERKLAEVDDARQQIAKALAESDLTVRNLEQRLGESTRLAGESAGRQKAELAGLHDALESARREAVQMRAQSDAAAEDFRLRLLALEAHVDAVSNERHRVEDERDAHARTSAAAEERARQAAAARDEVLAKVEDERARLAQEFAGELRKKADELDSARDAIDSLERENAEAKAGRDAAVRQRDELARRITRITDEQKRLLDGLADPETFDPGPRSVRAATVKPNIVEMSDADILPPLRERVITLPPARPVPVAPPKVRTI